MLETALNNTKDLFKAFKNPELMTSLKSTIKNSDVLHKLKLKSGLQTPMFAFNKDGMTVKNKAALTKKFLNEK